MQGRDAKSGVAVLLLTAVLFMPVVFQQVGNPISETLALIDSSSQTAAVITRVEVARVPVPFSVASRSSTSTGPVMTASSTVSITAVVDSVNDDRAGMWNVFAPGKNSQGIANDFTWSVSINASSTGPLIIKSIGIKHNIVGEAWSTYVTSSYPLVVTTLSGNQINTAYTQNLVQIPNGITMYKIYGQAEAMPFVGGTIQVTFTNGLVASATIPASNLRPVVIPSAAVSLSIESASTQINKYMNSNPSTGTSTTIVMAMFNVRLAAKNGNAKIGVTASSTPAFATLGSFILSKNGVPMTSIPSNFRPTLTITPSESSSFVRSSGGDSYVLYGDSSGMVNLSLSFIVQGNPSNDAYAVRFAGPVSWTAGTTTAATSSYPTGAGWTTSAIIAP